jgi:hypothetical protein
MSPFALSSNTSYSRKKKGIVEEYPSLTSFMTTETSYFHPVNSTLFSFPYGNQNIIVSG